MRKALLLLLLCIPLTAGAGTKGLKIVVKTQSGNSISLYSDSHALLIGISEYQATDWTDLESIPNELVTVEKALIEQGFKVEKHLNLNGKDLKAMFQSFIDNYGYDPENRLLFFFSGHGWTKENGKKGYLVPADAPNPDKDQKNFLRKALPMSQVLAWARQTEAKHSLYLFDSCFSGSIFQTKALPDKPPHITEATSLPVRQFITAGKANELVPSQSTFTPTFVDALKYGFGDLNKDGYVSGTELGLYLQEKVPRYGQQTPQFGKIQQYDLSRGDFIFVLPKASKVAISSPSTTTSVDSSAIEITFWNSIKDSKDQEMFEAYLKKYPAGGFSLLAKIELEKLEGAASPTDLQGSKVVKETPETEANNKQKENAERERTEVETELVRLIEEQQEKTPDIGDRIIIAVVPFEFEGQQNHEQSLGRIVVADLRRTGRFEPLPLSDFSGIPTQPNSTLWRALNVEALVVGHVRQMGDDHFEVSFQLFDVSDKNSGTGSLLKTQAKWTVGSAQLRQVAHQVSDSVYEVLTGIPGDFNTSIAFVVNAEHYRLMVADSDGYNAIDVLRSEKCGIGSPAWAPDGKHLAYVSCSSQSGDGVIWVQNIETGEMRDLFQLPKNSMWPSRLAWSPDGRRLAMALNTDGNSDIYILDNSISDSSLIRLTEHPFMDSEPSWSPSGRHLVFTSSRSGDDTYHIYRISEEGGSAERLTQEGRINSGASYSPDGSHLVMTTQQESGASFQIKTLNLENGKEEILTDGFGNRSPTFSPNGEMILYTTFDTDQSGLVSISANGRVKQMLNVVPGDVTDPAIVLHGDIFYPTWSSKKSHSTSGLKLW